MKRFLTILPIAFLIISGTAFITGFIYREFYLLAIGGASGMALMATFFLRIAYADDKRKKK